MIKKTMLLFGGSGMLGTRITELLSENFIIIAPSRRQVDLFRTEEIKKIIDANKTDYIVYAAGQTNQYEAEKNQEMTLKINAQIPGEIALTASGLKIPFIYFSTDAVFEGIQKDSGYKETDKISPVNFYGQTKAKGEEKVLSASTNHLVLRLVSLYTGNFLGKVDFVRRTLKKLSRGENIYAISDQYFNPSFTDDVVHALSLCLEKSINGIINLAAVDCITNYNFISLLAEKMGYDKENVLPVTFSSFFKEEKIKRGKFCCLDIQKARDLLGNGVLHANIQNLTTLSHQFLR